MAPDDEQRPRTRETPDSADLPAATTGTGSALGIGCIAVVIVLVVAAFLVRWIVGSW